MIRNLKHEGTIVNQPIHDGVTLKKWIHDGVVVWENGISNRYYIAVGANYASGSGYFRHQHIIDFENQSEIPKQWDSGIPTDDLGYNYRVSATGKFRSYLVFTGNKNNYVYLFADDGELIKRIQLSNAATEIKGVTDGLIYKSDNDIWFVELNDKAEIVSETKIYTFSEAAYHCTSLSEDIDIYVIWSGDYLNHYMIDKSGLVGIAPVWISGWWGSTLLTSGFYYANDKFYKFTRYRFNGTDFLRKCKFGTDGTVSYSMFSESTSSNNAVLYYDSERKKYYIISDESGAFHIYESTDDETYTPLSIPDSVTIKSIDGGEDFVLNKADLTVGMFNQNDISAFYNEIKTDEIKSYILFEHINGSDCKIICVNNLLQEDENNIYIQTS